MSAKLYYRDWDRRCLHCRRVVEDDDDAVAAFDLTIVGTWAVARTLCRACAGHQDEHAPDGRWIAPDQLVHELG